MVHLYHVYHSPIFAALSSVFMIFSSGLPQWWRYRYIRAKEEPPAYRQIRWRGHLAYATKAELHAVAAVARCTMQHAACSTRQQQQ
jgi:hypothetical protein